MIKGALLLSIGFGLGYAKAVHDLAPQDIQELATVLRDDLQEIAKMLREDIKQTTSGDKPVVEAVDDPVDDEPPTAA
jgi:hypothetical protein